jgi:hypothetical protein
MKKILLSSIVLLSCLCAKSQLTRQESICLTKEKKIVPFKGIPLEKMNSATLNKRTRGGKEWFSYFDAVNDTASTNGFYSPLWQDSLVKVRYSNGLFPADMTTFADNFDPQADAFANPPGSLYSPNTFSIGANNSYIIDSIRIFGRYFRRPSKSNIVDTLVITYSSSNTFFTTGNIANCNLYIDVQKTGVFADYQQDSVFTFMPALDANKITMRGPATITKKIPMTSASYPDSVTTGYFTFPMNVTVPANKIFLDSWTFISGDTYVANDTIGAFNSFRPYTYSFVNGAGDETFPPVYDNDLNENSTSSYTAKFLAPTTIGNNFYISRVFENGRTTAGVAYNGRNQYIDIEYLVNCVGCFPTSTSEFKSNISATANPNPASSNVTFALNLKENAKKVTIELTNVVGQTVKTTQIANVNANNSTKIDMNVADLSAGMYIYTINADGQKISNKLMVK